MVVQGNALVFLSLRVNSVPFAFSQLRIAILTYLLLIDCLQLNMPPVCLFFRFFLAFSLLSSSFLFVAKGNTLVFIWMQPSTNRHYIIWSRLVTLPASPDSSHIPGVAPPFAFQQRVLATTWAESGLDGGHRPNPMMPPVSQPKTSTHPALLLDPRRPQRLATPIGTCLMIGHDKVVMHFRTSGLSSEKHITNRFEPGSPKALRLVAQEPEARNAPETPPSWL